LDGQKVAQQRQSDWLMYAFARVLNIDPALAYAVLEVESGGSGFDANGRLLLRFETHLFGIYLNNPTLFAKHFYHDPVKAWTDQKWRRAEVQAWTVLHVGATRESTQDGEWAAFEFAAAINRPAAIKACSLGSAQILGSNHAALGYATPEDMLADFQASSLNQLVGFFAYCTQKPGMQAALQQKDYNTIARLYNGSGQVDVYAPRIEQVYKKWKGILGV
jgi:hypothetical protein